MPKKSERNARRCIFTSVLARNFCCFGAAQSDGQASGKSPRRAAPANGMVSAELDEPLRLGGRYESRSSTVCDAPVSAPSADWSCAESK